MAWVCRSQRRRAERRRTGIAVQFGCRPTTRVPSPSLKSADPRVPHRAFLKARIGLPCRRLPTAAALNHAHREDFVNQLLYTDMVTYLPECLMTKIDIAKLKKAYAGK